MYQYGMEFDITRYFTSKTISYILYQFNNQCNAISSKSVMIYINDLFMK